jgi:hypothetical protein
MVATSLMHWPSQKFFGLQQNGSLAQIWVTHGSQALLSALPWKHKSWLQAAGGAGGGVGALPQLCWQIDLTSPTQMLSHELAQQNPSLAQI